jgi:hypothetical protein
MLNKNKRNENTLGLLEIFENFVNKYYSEQNAWMLFFEDDVRPVNINIKDNLKVLHNIPKDAELIRPYTGINKMCNLKKIEYRISYGGGLNHAFYISLSGCKKVLNYVYKYKWKYVGDIDIYKLGKYCGGYPTGYDGWSLESSDNQNIITSELDENEKINIYGMSEIIFNQTSMNCLPII